ncbi:NAD+ synthase [bacterium]|nr:MAG: NAD+ synthase [bacterium]
MQKGDFLRIAIAQINCTVGDLNGNSAKIKEYIDKARRHHSDIVCFPELAVTGYPPEDLLIKSKFIRDNLARLKEIAKYTENIIAIVGFADRNGKELYNAAAVIYNGKIKGVYRKSHLPNYGVFDEKRYFNPGNDPLVFKYGRVIFGVNICEDIWHLAGPTEAQAKRGAKLIININSSPYHAGKIREREAVVCKQAKVNKIAIVYTNLVGGQDELVFDGQSIAVDAQGKVIARAEAFKEQMPLFDMKIPHANIKSGKKIINIASKPLSFGGRAPVPALVCKPLEIVNEVYQALVLGLRDYVLKNNFSKVAIGISGGIDSALVATLAADALGVDNVTGVFMPSRYSSQESEIDARELAQNLGIKILNIPIEEIYKVYLGVLDPCFGGLEKNITEENLQARIRGNILMALSNKFGWLVLTTGNKSEMGVGYATLYGDMAGGFALIKDVPKTLVYKLVKYRNSLKTVIPERIITKEPTAELKPNQKDSDTLPVYEMLDPILKAYIEEDKDSSEIIAFGFDKETVLRVSNMVDKSEYKRRQSPPGVKITPKSFGRDRRMPITNKYHG